MRSLRLRLELGRSCPDSQPSSRGRRRDIVGLSRGSACGGRVGRSFRCVTRTLRSGNGGEIEIGQEFPPGDIGRVGSRPPYVSHRLGETRRPILLVHIGQSDVDNLSATTACPVAGAAVAVSRNELPRLTRPAAWQYLNRGGTDRRRCEPRPHAVDHGHGRGGAGRRIV